VRKYKLLCSCSDSISNVGYCKRFHYSVVCLSVTLGHRESRNGHAKNLTFDLLTSKPNQLLSTSRCTTSKFHQNLSMGIQHTTKKTYKQMHAQKQKTLGIHVCHGQTKLKKTQTSAMVEEKHTNCALTLNRNNYKFGAKPNVSLLSTLSPIGGKFKGVNSPGSKVM